MTQEGTTEPEPTAPGPEPAEAGGIRARLTAYADKAPPWVRGIFAALRVLALFLPELLLGGGGLAIGAVIGAIGSVAAFVGGFSELFSGGGAWGRAGPIALLIPVLVAVISLGPFVVASWLGLALGLTLAVHGHALVLVLFRKKLWHDRHWLKVTPSAVAILLGPFVALSISHGDPTVGSLLLSPLYTAPFMPLILPGGVAFGALIWAIVALARKLRAR